VLEATGASSVEQAARRPRAHHCAVQRGAGVAQALLAAPAERAAREQDMMSGLFSPGRRRAERTSTSPGRPRARATRASACAAVWPRRCVEVRVNTPPARSRTRSLRPRRGRGERCPHVEPRPVRVRGDARARTISRARLPRAVSVPAAGGPRTGLYAGHRGLAPLLCEGGAVSSATREALRRMMAAHRWSVDIGPRRLLVDEGPSPDEPRAAGVETGSSPTVGPVARGSRLRAGGSAAGSPQPVGVGGPRTGAPRVGVRGGAETVSPRRRAMDPAEGTAPRCGPRFYVMPMTARWCG